jgi:hypothetical protein
VPDRLRIDYLGGWNERGYDRRWYGRCGPRRRSRLRVGRARRGRGGWAVAALLDDPAVAAAVDIVGVHYPCSGGDGGDAASCRSPARAAAVGKPCGRAGGSQPLVTSRDGAPLTAATSTAA